MPKVGIFFFIDGEILSSSTEIESGERYGEAIQYGGHFEFWEKIIPKNSIQKKFKARSYDAYPRGRVVYFPKKKIFYIYIDPCLKQKQIKIILDEFDLHNAKTKVSYDEHYQCKKCNPFFMD